MNNPSKRNGYTLSKRWWDFAGKNPNAIRPVHAALYFWIVGKNNKLYWKNVFGLPTLEAMRHIGIKDRRFFRKTLSDLELWGFIKVVHKSQNQYDANRITVLIDRDDTTADQKHPRFNQDTFRKQDEPTEQTEDEELDDDAWFASLEPLPDYDK
jgi:hypothetical protein